MRKTEPANVTDGAELVIIQWWGREWLIKAFPFGGSQAIRPATKDDLATYPIAITKSGEKDA